MRAAQFSLPFLIALLTPALSAQATPDASPADNGQSVLTLHTTARLVVLDVAITDGTGKPVHGLKPSDFTITEDGVPQKLASFVEHGEPQPAAPASPLPANTFAVQPPPAEDQTKTVIVTSDITSVSPASEMPEFPSGGAVNTGYVRNDIAAFLKTAPPTQPVAIVRLDWQGMHLVQGLTTDRSVLMEAIASKRMLPPLGFVVRFAHATGSPAQQLGRYINSIPGRVNLVFITYGGGTPLGQMRDDFPDIESVVQNLSGPNRTLRLNRVATYIIPLTQANVFANEAMIEMANAGGGHAYFIGIRQALSEIAATGSDYYTVSYVPANPDWNGAFRKINVKVAGFPQPPPPESWSAIWSEVLGWTEMQKSKIIYRPGYYARPEPRPTDLPAPSLPDAPPAPASPRRIISYSPKGDPNGAIASSQLRRALVFGSLPPDRIKFTIVVTPSPTIEKLKPGAPPPKDNYLTPPFLADAYCNVRIHYWIDPQYLRFTQDPGGSYSDELQFVVGIDRDDGVQANSLSTPEQIRLSEEGMSNLQISGITFDQTIAIPLSGNPIPGNFFLRVAVSERSSGNVGAIEIPTERIQLPTLKK